MRDEIVALVESADTYAAVQLVQRQGTPRDIAARFDALVSDLYWTAKDLPAVVAVARGGIHYCLTKMASTNADEREFFGSRAKKMAYNLASFTWPGWDEPGIAPSPSDIAAGMDAAKLNLRLALELGKPEDRVQGAHWLLGAHLLAANDPAAALEEFRQCDPESRPLFAGYVLLAQVMLEAPSAQQKFDDFLAAVPGEDEKDRSSIRAQLETAHRVFVERA